MKFVTMKNEDGTEEMFIFPRSIHHDCMAEALEGIRNQTHGNWERHFRQPVAAGFVSTDGTCFGNSETLGLSAREFDTALLRAQAG